MHKAVDIARPITFEVAAGYTVRASSASIAFLWSNWDVLFAFYSSKVKARRGLENDAPGHLYWEFGGYWQAQGFGGKGQWWLERAKIGVQHGSFAYFTKAQSLACPLWARTVMEYDRIDDELISYRGRGVAALPRAFRPLHPMLRFLGSRATLYINKIGGEVAELITEQPEKVCAVAGEEAWAVYKTFMREEQAVKSGHRGDCRYFVEGDAQVRPASEDFLFLKKKLQRIEDLLDVRRIDLADYRASLSVFSQDPELALVKNRMIIDKMVHLIYEKEVGEPSRGSELTRRIDDLKSKSLNVPRSMLALMGTVADLGDPNCQLTKRAGVLDTSAYIISFGSTLRITEWFFTEYLTSETRLSADRDF